MAGPWYAESLSLQSKSNDTSFTDLVSLEIADAPADTDVLLIWSVGARNDATNNAGIWRLYDATGAVEVTRQSARVKDFVPTDMRPMGAMALWQTGATPGTRTFAIQYANEVSGVVRGENARILAYPLGSADAYAEDADYTATVNDPGSWTQALELLTTPAADGDYLLIASATYKAISSVGAAIRVLVDGTPVETFVGRPENAGSAWSYTFLGKVSLTGAGAHTVALEFKASDGMGNTTLEQPRLALIRCDALASLHYAENRTAAGGTETAFQTFLSTSPTLAAEDYILLASYWLYDSSTSVSSYSRATEDAAQTFHAEFEVNVSGTPMAALIPYRKTFTAGPHTFTLDRRSETTGATTTMDEAAIVLFQPPAEIRAGVLAVTEGQDGASFAGTSYLGGAFGLSEGQDTVAFTGTVVAAGALLATEGQDVAAFAGAVSTAGMLVAGEARDGVAFTATLVDGGALVTTETADTALFAGTLANAGGLASSEVGDVLVMQAHQYRRIVARAALRGGRETARVLTGMRQGTTIAGGKARIMLTGRTGGTVD